MDVDCVVVDGGGTGVVVMWRMIASSSGDVVPIPPHHRYSNRSQPTFLRYELTIKKHDQNSWVLRSTQQTSMRFQYCYAHMPSF